MIETSEYQMILGARVAVLKLAIGALIETHPNPGRFADLLERATVYTQIEHMSAANATPVLRQAATALEQELVGLARDAAARRQPGTDPAG